MRKTIKQTQSLNRFLLGSAMALMLPIVGVQAQDLTLPTGENVVGGSASFDRSTAGRLNVNQSSQRAVIEWQGFDIGKNATTQFNQPSANALAVNRVVGGNDDPTMILGTLKANGQVMVLDKNGIIFGQDSIVDVGGIIASTGDVDTDAVMRGDAVLTLRGMGDDGAVVNHGSISVSEGGMAAFVAPHVENNGVIHARLGRIALAAEQSVATVDLYGDGLVEIALDDAKAQALSAVNTGQLIAEGGVIAMTSGDAETLVDSVINLGGMANASSVSQKGGKIIIGGQGQANVSGQVKADGATGGGQIDVRAQTIIVEDTATVTANATDNGDGGTIISFAEDHGQYEGDFSATAGTNGGDGGFVETSGKMTVGFGGAPINVDVSSAMGQGGTWLIDPTDIVIDNILATSLVNTMNAGGAGIVNTASANGDVGDITVNADIVWGGNGSLSLIADNNIVVNNIINAQKTNGNGTQGAITMTAEGRIQLDANVSTGRGDINLSGKEQVLINQSLLSDKGTITLMNVLAAPSVDNDQGIRVGFNGSVTANNKDVQVTSTNGRFIVQGNGVVQADKGDVTINANAVKFWGGGRIVAKNATINADIDISQFNGTGGVLADNLTGSAGTTADFTSTATNIKNVNGFTTNGAFALRDSDGGLTIKNTVSTSGGAATITAMSTANKAVLLDTGAMIDTDGGLVTISHDKTVTIKGEIDVTTPTTDGTINITGSKIDLKAGSILKADNASGGTTGVMNLVATDGDIKQNAAGYFITSELRGSATKNAVFDSTTNEVVSIGNFTTGEALGHNGGLTLTDATGDLTVTGAVTTKQGAVNLTNAAGDLITAGTIDTRNGTSAGNITLSTDDNIQLTGTAGVHGQAVDLTATNGTITQDLTTTLTAAGTLKTNSSGEVRLNSLTNAINQIGLSAITSTGDYWVEDSAGGLSISDNITTKGGQVRITTKDTGTGKLTLAKSKVISTAGGNVTLTHDKTVTLSGEIDVTGGAADADITIVGDEIVLAGTSILKTDKNPTAEISLTANAGRINQAAAGQIVTGALSGSATEDAIFNSTTNEVSDLKGFTTGQAGVDAGGFKLINATGDLSVTNMVSTKGGNVSLESTNGALSTSGIETRDGINRGDITLTADGNITGINSANNIALDGDTVTLTATNGIIDYFFPAKILADELKTTSAGNVRIFNGANEINEIGDSTITGAGNYTVFEQTGGLDVNGNITTNGGDISIGSGGNAGEKLVVKGGKSLTSNGGKITLTHNQDIDVLGTIDSSSAVADSEIKLQGKTVMLDKNSIVKTNAGFSLNDKVELVGLNGTITQKAGGVIETGILTGASADATDLAGTGNKISVVDTFSTGSVPQNRVGGLSLVNSQNVTAKNDVTSNGGRIAFDITGDLTVDTGATINANGGDIDLDQTGVFNSVDSNSVKTSGTGKIDLEQNAAGTVRTAVRSIDNTGTGANSLTLGAGTFTETASTHISDNLLITGAGQGNTIITKDFHTSSGGNNRHWFRVNSGQTADFKDLTIDGAGKRTTQAVRFEGQGSVEDVTFSNINYRAAVDNKGVAVAAVGDGVVNITDVTMTNIGRNGVNYNSANAAGSVVDNLTYTGKGAGTYINNGVNVNNTNNVIIRNSTFTDAIGTADPAIASAGVAVSGSSGVQILGNEMNNVGVGVEINNAANVTTTGNTIQNAGADSIAGIRYTDSEGAIIGGATNALRNIVDGYKTGIELSGSTGANIQRNTITDASDTGILLKLASHGATLLSNTLNTAAVAIGLDASNTARVEKNTVNGATDTGIKAQNADNVTLFDNDVFDALNGIDVSAVTQLTIEQNKLDAKSAAATDGNKAIVVDGSASAIILNNDIDDYRKGIELKNSAGSSVNKNSLTGLNNGTGTGLHIQSSDMVTVGDGTNGNRNTVDFFNNGIRIDASTNAVLDNNLVRDSLQDAVVVQNGSTNARVEDTRILRAERYGVRVDGSTDVKILESDIDTVNDTAIWAENGANNLTIGQDGKANDVLNGLRVSDSSGLDVKDASFVGRTAQGVGVDLINAAGATFGDGTNANRMIVDEFATGFVADNSTGLIMNNNLIQDMSANAIELKNGSNNAKLTDLRINRVSGNGIDTNASTAVEIVGADIDNVDQKAINLASGSHDAVLTNNNINGSATAVEISNSARADLKQNTLIGDAGNGVGVNLVGAADTKIGDGTVANANDVRTFATGILAAASTEVSIDNNTIRNNTANAVSLNAGSNNARIANNTFTGNTGVNISISASDDATVDTNIITGGLDGVRLIDADQTTIVGNTITAAQDGVEIVGTSDATTLNNNDFVNNTANGLYTTGNAVGSVALLNNRFTNNQTGARFESGAVDLTSPTFNSFTDGNDALAFDGSGNPTIAGNTLGTSVFNGQANNYVTLSNGALAGEVINALNASFDGFVPLNSKYGPGILSRTQLDALEAKIFDFDDDNALGNIFVGLVPGISDEDALSDALAAFAAANQAVQVTFNGLPPVSFDAAAFNALTPFAGGDGSSAEELAGIEPAAGDDNTACWGAFGDQSASGSITYNLTGDMGSLLANDGC